jgi:hypothetical protein
MKCGMESKKQVLNISGRSVAESIVENNLRFLININDNERFVRAERLNQKFPVIRGCREQHCPNPPLSFSLVFFILRHDMIKEKGRRMKHGQ